jgi:bla regulator protein BlaR1
LIRKLCIAGTVCASMAIAQSAATSNSASSAKPMAFEVVSIRQNVAGGKVQAFGATPDGFRMLNASLSRVIMAAYVPRTGEAIYWEPVGFPAWVNSDHYDIEAKIEEADRAEWQKPEAQLKMLRAMLQTMLAERCKLVVHREVKEAPVYYLELGKGGPRFRESKDGDAPGGRQSPFPGGGVVEREGSKLHFYQAPIKLLASYLTNRNLGGAPIQDRTGLTRRYDFVVDWGAWTGGLAGAEDASDPGPTMFSAVGALGLKLVSAKGQVETLVLDHVERPSEN